MMVRITAESERSSYLGDQNSMLAVPGRTLDERVLGGILIAPMVALRRALLPDTTQIITETINEIMFGDYLWHDTPLCFLKK